MTGAIGKGGRPAGRPYAAAMKRAAVCLATLLFGINSALAAPANADIAPEAATGFSDIKEATASRFMAVTANPLATDAAYSILKQGGSAMDAAIAAQLVLGLVEPQSSGIGGGAFLLHWDAKVKELTSWDGRETAPAAVTPEHFLLPSGAPLPFFNAVIGGHAVGAPGVPALLAETHRHYGKLPWAALFEPAIQLADAGFPISPRLHLLLEKMPKVAVNPAITAYFFDEPGKPKPVGTLLNNPAYAQTLRALARGGAEAFYRGPLAEQIVAAVQSDPNRRGRLTTSDMADYRARAREPVCGQFRVYVICGMPPPSSGGTTVIALLGMLATFETDTLPGHDPTRVHLFAEASRLAFADRDRYVADPDFVEVPTQGLVDPAYLKQRAGLIRRDARLPGAEAGTPPGAEALARIDGRSPALPSTSHLNVVDAEGNVVSMTTSIETAFGSRVMVGGFLLNNQLTDFSFIPSTKEAGLIANRIEPGKRPRSSMAPTIVFRDGQPMLAIGSPGGARIIDYVARTLWDMLDRDTPVAQAIAAPHVVDMGRGLELEEDRFPKETVVALRALGHTVSEKSQNSGLHGISLGNRLRGGADPRREGTVRGE